MEQFESVRAMIDNLRSENADQRLSSMRGIHLIARTLGPERTRDELLLYLTDYLDDSDDVLRVFASALGTMLEEVGGMAYLTSLLNPLELLCGLDEATVRDEAVAALRHLGACAYAGNSAIDSNNNNNKSNATTAALAVDGEVVSKAQDEYVATVMRLASGTPQCRSSACSLLVSVYTHASSAPAVRAAALRRFRELCADSEIMVRRAACVAIGRSDGTLVVSSHHRNNGNGSTESSCNNSNNSNNHSHGSDGGMAAALGAKQAGELLDVLAALTKDGSDGVRLQAVPSTIAMLTVLPPVQHAALLQGLRTLALDASWRVRYMIADSLDSFADAVAASSSPPSSSSSTATAAAAAAATDMVGRHVAPTFRALCQDAEPEIRAAAVGNMAAVLAACRDTSTKKDLLVTGTRLVSDASSHVRVSLASALLRSVAHVGKELWSSVLVPTCTTLLSDADADVRLALVSSFSAMGNAPSAAEAARELAPQLVPVVLALADDPKWRLREVVVSQVPYVITSLSSHEGSSSSSSSIGAEEEEVLEVCLERVTDRVATIRAAAVQSCCRLVSEHGASWAAAQLLPRMAELARDGNYLHRVALCNFYAACARVDALDALTCATAVWPTLQQQLAVDAVVNVRMAAARAVVALHAAHKLPARDAEALLGRLQKDAAEDVRDAATRPPPPPSTPKGPPGVRLHKEHAFAVPYRTEVAMMRKCNTRTFNTNIRELFKRPRQESNIKAIPRDVGELPRNYVLKLLFFHQPIRLSDLWDVCKQHDDVPLDSSRHLRLVLKIAMVQRWVQVEKNQSDNLYYYYIHKTRAHEVQELVHADAVARKAQEADEAAAQAQRARDDVAVAAERVHDSIAMLQGMLARNVEQLRRHNPAYVATLPYVRDDGTIDVDWHKSNSSSSSGSSNDTGELAGG